jgi:hypothetical protein
LLGSGCFYRRAEAVFLVTAAHVLDAVDENQVGVPIAPLRDVRIRKLLEAKKTVFEDTNLDLAVVRIINQLFLEEVVANWNVLSKEHCGSHAQLVGAEFLIAGFPLLNVSLDGIRLVPKSLFQLYTVGIDGVADRNPSEFDVLMRHTKSAINAAGDGIDVVSMEGASGSPVWKLDHPVAGVWSPASCLKLIAVQESFKPGFYIRAKRWCLVEELIDRAQP